MLYTLTYIIYRSVAVHDAVKDINNVEVEVGRILLVFLLLSEETLKAVGLLEYNYLRLLAGVRFCFDFVGNFGQTAGIIVIVTDVATFLT